MEKIIKDALVALPTGKPHISFSEYSGWAACSWRHKLEHVQHLGEPQFSAFLTYGTVQHKCCDNLLSSSERNPNIEYGIMQLEKNWKEHPEFEAQIKLADAKRSLIECTAEIIPFLDSTFPGWETVDTEFQLYESVEGTPHAFKGFIDAIIKVPVKKKMIVWLIDWKSASFGWLAAKKQDRILQSQLVLYKKFYAQKLGIDIKDIRIGFVLLKRTAKKGQKCELVPVSAGDLTIDRAGKQVLNMLASVNKGIALKNRESCKYCAFHNTPHCT